MTLADIKSDTRKQAFAARKAAHQTMSASAAEAAFAHFVDAGFPDEGDTIAAYCPIRTEIDPTPLMLHLHTLGKTICVPEIEGAGLPLDFRVWHPGVEMAEGAFGAAVPVGTPVAIPDVLIVPLVAFDRMGMRLGYGGGFYDRTLEGLRATGRAFAVATLTRRRNCACTD